MRTATPQAITTNWILAYRFFIKLSFGKSVPIAYNMINRYPLPRHFILKSRTKRKRLRMIDFSHWNQIYNYEKNSRKACHGSPADFFARQGGWISSLSKKPAPQLHMASSTGIILRPNAVSEYMVLGGLSGITSRCIIPHSSKSCNCCDSIFGVAFGIMRPSSM